MYQELKNNWQPSATLDNLKLRAEFYQKIRAFFSARNVLEVETPLLCQHTVTDPHIESFQVKNKQTYYLQTSPEYAMKRLLAAGSGPIFQICKAFRQEESGSQHNPEFTMLEWYRPGFNHHDLMNEIDHFFQYVLDTMPADKISYRNLFLTNLSIDPINAELTALHNLIQHHNISVDLTHIDYDTALQILLTHLIEPKIGLEKPLFVFDFPASQAALSKINGKVAERFEAYINGKEVANGFNELTNATEQKNRFVENQTLRDQHNQYVPNIDRYLIDALDYGLPDCAGVAIGLDRLLMQLAKTNYIQDVISFTWEKA